MSKKSLQYPDFAERASALNARRNLKMARSAQAYLRGNTLKFYEWIEAAAPDRLPQGPALWICGDCHVGNMGPVANAESKVKIQIRDFDQTVIGNPAHDLIRLGLSLASAARGFDLPGVTTARILEQMIDGYAEAVDGCSRNKGKSKQPECVRYVMGRALGRSWSHLASECIGRKKPTFPLGKHFWPLSQHEAVEITQLFQQREVQQLATLLRSRNAGYHVEVLDAAYWVKGCSSLGRLRIAVLLSVSDKHTGHGELCFMDIKEAVKAAAPRYTNVGMPRDNAQRIVMGAQHLAPNLGERIVASRFEDRAVFIRELLPQDLKLELDDLTGDEAIKTARFLASVVAKAHADQLDDDARRAWRKELDRNRLKTLDAPSWLWTSVIELLVSHESSYLEHCRRYALEHATAA